MVICVAVQSCAAAQIPLKNGPELSLPLTDRKLVIAHCMTNIIRFKGHKLEDSCDPEYFPATGNSTAVLGGLTQVKVLEDPVLSQATLEEAVEFEMRAAIRSGIDGFQFYYTLGNEGWDEIIKAYLKVATEKKIPFQFTFCVSHPAGGTESLKIQAFARRINGIMDAAGRNNEHWLRTPDGRLIVYMWYGEQLADVPGGKGDAAGGAGAAVPGGGRPEAYYVAGAFARLAEAVHERFACVYSINAAISPEKLSAYLDYFPAVWMWTLPWSDHYPGVQVAQACRDRHRTFTGSVFCDFYTSKLLKKGTWDMYHTAADAVAAGMGQVERKYITTGLSYNFRKLLEFGMEQGAPIINVITWNDYPEGHHLAPEASHNDGFAELLLYYKRRWLGEGPGKEMAITFFKKYRHDILPHPYGIPVVPFQEETIPAASEDSIEVLTILKEPATLVLKGREFAVPAGLAATRIPLQPGPVLVEVQRKGQDFIHFQTPEAITDAPYRSDRLTYTLSSEYAAYYEDIFGKTTNSSN